MIDDLSMDAKFHDFAERDRQTDQWTDGAMDGRSNGWTETLAYWDAMDASKNAGKACRFETFLDMSTHLYKPVCPSVRPSVRHA